MVRVPAPFALPRTAIETANASVGRAPPIGPFLWTTVWATGSKQPAACVWRASPPRRTIIGHEKLFYNQSLASHHGGLREPQTVVAPCGCGCGALAPWL